MSVLDAQTADGRPQPTLRMLDAVAITVRVTEIEAFLLEEVREAPLANTAEDGEAEPA